MVFFGPLSPHFWHKGGNLKFTKPVLKDTPEFHKGDGFISVVKQPGIQKHDV